MSHNFKDDMTIDNNKYLGWYNTSNFKTGIVALNSSNNLLINNGGGSISLNPSGSSHTFINSGNTGLTLVDNKLAVGYATTANTNSSLTIASNGFLSVNTSFGNNTGYLGFTGSNELSHSAGSSILSFGQNHGSLPGHLEFYTGTSGEHSFYTGADTKRFQILANGTSNFLPNGTNSRLSITDTQVSVSATTASTSATTGALVVSGGFGVNGNISVTGTVDGRDVSTDGSNLDNLYTTIGLSALTSAEVDQLENINSTVISSTQWGYLGAMNQGITSTSSVVFAGITTGNTLITSTLESTTIGTGSLIINGGTSVAKTLQMGQGVYLLGNSKALSETYEIVLGPAPALTNNDYCSLIRSTSIVASHFGSTLQFLTHRTTSNTADPTLALTIDASQNSQFEGNVIVDNTSTTALLVRKNSAGGDVFTVDTTNTSIKLGPGAGIQNSLLSLYGTATSANLGPHILCTTTQDTYPTFQLFNSAHDIITLNFDSYYANATNDHRSSHFGSNFQIAKFSNALQFNYASSVSAGSAVTYSTGMSLSNAGIMSILQTTASTTTSTGALLVNGGVGVVGNISVGGTVDGRDVSVDGSTLDNLNTTIGLSALTSAEVDQLENINSTVISSTQWGYLGAMNQGVASTSSVVFTGITTGNTVITSTIDSTGTGNGTLVVSGGIGIAKTVNIGSSLFLYGNSSGLTETAEIVLGPAPSIGNKDYCSVIRSENTFASGFFSSLKFYTHGFTSAAYPSLALTIDTSQNAIFERNATVQNSLIVDSSITSALVVRKDNNTGNILNVNTLNNIVSIPATTTSTTTSTGALIVSGGTGIVGAMNIGGKLTLEYQAANAQITLLRQDGGGNIDIRVDSSNVLRFTNQNSNGDIIFNGGSGGDYFDFGASGSTTTAPLYITNSTTSTSTSTGAFIVSGGVGIAGRLSVGSLTRLLSVTDSTTVSSGAVVVSGGTGIVGNLNVGGVSRFENSTTIANTSDVASSSGGALNIDGDLVLATTNPRLYFPRNNVGIPTFTTRSAGTKIVLFSDITGNTVDYAIGIGTNTLWSSVNTTTGSFHWYAGTTRIMDLDGLGDLMINGTIDSTNATTGALVVAGGISTAKNLFVGGTATIDETSTSALLVRRNNSGINVFTVDTTNNNVIVNSTVASTVINTGAFQVRGGASIAQYLNVESDITVFSDGAGFVFNFGGSFRKEIGSGLRLQIATPAGSPSSGYKIVSTTSAILRNYTNTTITDYVPVSIIDTTESSSTTSGALVISGGVGIAKNLNVGGNIQSIRSTAGDQSIGVYSQGASSRAFLATDNLVDSGWSFGQDTDDAFRFKGGAASGNNFTSATTQVTLKAASAGVEIHPTTESSSTVTGALVIGGGVGISKNLNVGGTTKVNSTTASTSSSTGALTVAGGIGVAGDMNIGGQITSTVTTGTAPFVVASTTNVANLNASTLSGATFESPGAIGGSTPGSGAFTTLSASGISSITNSTTSTNTSTGALLVSGGVGISGRLNVGGQVISDGTITIDINSTEAFLVRKNSDGGDILAVDTTNTSLKLGPGAGIQNSLLSLYGTASNATLGPHIMATTTEDIYPVFQLFNSAHDIITLNFDSYFADATSDTRSSHLGSNFQIAKFSNSLQFNYASSVSQGSAITFSTGMFLANDGVLSTRTILPSTTNAYNLGSASFQWQNIFSQNAVTVSDKRQKKDIIPERFGLDFINKLRPVEYTYKSTNSRAHGLIAQEVEHAVQDHGIDTSEFYMYDQEADIYNMKYMELTSPLIKSIQELTQRILQLELQLANLQR